MKTSKEGQKGSICHESVFLTNSISWLQHVAMLKYFR
jgi:hypothetical protein